MIREYLLYLVVELLVYDRRMDTVCEQVVITTGSAYGYGTVLYPLSLSSPSPADLTNIDRVLQDISDGRITPSFTGL